MWVLHWQLCREFSQVQAFHRDIGFYFVFCDDSALESVPRGSLRGLKFVLCRVWGIAKRHRRHVWVVSKFARPCGNVAPLSSFQPWESVDHGSWTHAETGENLSKHKMLTSFYKDQRYTPCQFASAKPPEVLEGLVGNELRGCRKVYTSTVRFLRNDVVFSGFRDSGFDPKTSQLVAAGRWM